MSRGFNISIFTGLDEPIKYFGVFLIFFTSITSVIKLFLPPDISFIAGLVIFISIILLLLIYRYAVKLRLIKLQNYSAENEKTKSLKIVADAMFVKDESASISQEKIVLYNPQRIQIGRDEKSYKIKVKKGKKLHIRYDSDLVFSIMIRDKWHEDRDSFSNPIFFEADAISNHHIIPCRKDENLFLTMWQRKQDISPKVEFELWLE